MGSKVKSNFIKFVTAAKFGEIPYFDKVNLCHLDEIPIIFKTYVVFIYINIRNMEEYTKKQSYKC